MRGSPQGYKIRDATLADIPSILVADRAASELFRPTGLIRDMATIPESIPANTLAQAIDTGLVFVAADGDDEAVGFAMMDRRSDDLYLDQISVDPAHGRQGLGRRLMQAVMDHANTLGCRTVTLSTFRDLSWNGPFYRSLGFREMPRAKLEDWMLEIERAQAETMDVSQRCFMRRQVASCFIIPGRR